MNSFTPCDICALNNYIEIIHICKPCAQKFMSGSHLLGKEYTNWSFRAQKYSSVSDKCTTCDNYSDYIWYICDSHDMKSKLFTKQYSPTK